MHVTVSSNSTQPLLAATNLVFKSMLSIAISLYRSFSNDIICSLPVADNIKLLDNVSTSTLYGPRVDRFNYLLLLSAERINEFLSPLQSCRFEEISNSSALTCVQQANSLSKIGKMSSLSGSVVGNADFANLVVIGQCKLVAAVCRSKNDNSRRNSIRVQ